ncbi:hypothetical protein ACR9E3_03240 [Actinomycetospora sp. C-140]
MPDLVLGAAALEQARTGFATEARRVPALTDHLAAPAGGLGDLDAARAMLGALDEVVRVLGGELGSAGARLEGLDRALDAAITAIRSGDRDAAAGLSAA